MNTLELLKAGREIISAPEKWTKYTYGRTAEGSDTNGPQSFLRAVKFCSLGALLKAVGSCPGEDLEGESYTIMEAAQVALCRVASTEDIAVYNDEHTYEEVIAVWDRAIAEEAAK